jgi:branched-chain amino acid transport system ATP-binding protein
MTALLELDQLVAGHNGVPVVYGIDLRVDTGEVVTLLGPNGAGKTTTLQTISGVLDIIRGDVRLRGSSLRRTSPPKIARSGCIHVPEDRALFHDLTVAENLRLVVRRDNRARERVLDFFPALRPILSRRAGLLSGGEQQMLAIGRALALRPALLLVDEMSLGLAPVIVAQLLPIMRRVADEDGTGVLLVEQHVDLALSIADRAYVLSHGVVTMSGAGADIARETAALQASYLGETADAVADLSTNEGSP